MKKRLMLLALLLCVLLTGCASIEETIFEGSGISEEEAYLEYEAYSESGKLTQQGYYAEPEEETVDTEGKAHVTFAENGYLKVVYYSDAEHTHRLDTTGCYLVPGTQIYASVTLKNSAPKNEYEFAGFRICLYEDGECEELQRILPEGDAPVFAITEDYADAELSIEPIGQYMKRTISLSATVKDEDDDDEEPASVEWTVNDQTVTGNEASIDPVSSYIVSFSFDKDLYFYESSEPECYYSSDDDGIVIFERSESSENIPGYSVVLRKYIDVTLKNMGKQRTVWVNGGEAQTIKFGESLKIEHQKYGNTVTIVTDEEWPALEKSKDLFLQQGPEEQKDGTYKYTLVVPPADSVFTFNPNEFTETKHGTVTFTCFGETVENPVPLKEGTKIYYDQATAEENYWLGDGEHFITVTNETETRKKLADITFVERLTVEVALPQPEYGGTIRYYKGVNGEKGDELFGNTATLTSGTEIIMDFEPWEGWQNNYKDGETYTVTEEPAQTVRIDNEDVSAAFSEDDEHKPKLTVVLDKSVGDMKFTFAAAGMDETEYSYTDSWIGKSTVFKDRSIGTQTDITFSMKDRALPSGSAVKILVEKTDIHNHVTREYSLINDLTAKENTIPLYDGEDPATAETWYKAVKITISVVENVEQFTAPSAPENATVTVTGRTYGELKTGDLVEASEYVTVIIRPNNGYYLSGKNVQKGYYLWTIRFSKYQSEIQTILDEHPVEKYSKIVLTEKDEYGVFIYRLDGQPVSGTINVKPGQKLEVTYTITSSEYVIKKFIGKGQSETETIRVTAEMDGQTIDRDTFGIEVKGA